MLQQLCRGQNISGDFLGQFNNTLPTRVEKIFFPELLRGPHFKCCYILPHMVIRRECESLTPFWMSSNDGKYGREEDSKPVKTAGEPKESELAF